MAGTKDCPTCGLTNPLRDRRCDCGYDFAAGHVPGAVAGCQGCGAAAQTRYVSFHQNIGLVAFRLHSSIDGQLCKHCIDSHFWKKTLVTLALGWWGVISFLVTPFILLNNVVRYLSSRGMEPPPHPGAEAAGRGGHARPPQLVGQTCVHCGKRIPSEIDGRFCETCGAPAHDACLRPGAGTGCRTCGAAAGAAENERVVTPAGGS